MIFIYWYIKNSIIFGICTKLLQVNTIRFIDLYFFRNNSNCCKEFSACCSKKHKTSDKIPKVSSPITNPRLTRGRKYCQKSCRSRNCSSSPISHFCTPSNYCSPKCCSPFPKCCSSRREVCFCSCFPHESCPRKRKLRKCQETPLFSIAVKEGQSPNKRKPSQTRKCCCEECISKLYPKMKPCFNNCCNSSIRYDSKFLLGIP